MIPKNDRAWDKAVLGFVADRGPRDLEALRHMVATKIGLSHFEQCHDVVVATLQRLTRKGKVYFDGYHRGWAVPGWEARRAEAERLGRERVEAEKEHLREENARRIAEFSDPRLHWVDMGDDIEARLRLLEFQRDPGFAAVFELDLKEAAEEPHAVKATLEEMTLRGGAYARAWNGIVTQVSFTHADDAIDFKLRCPHTVT